MSTLKADFIQSTNPSIPVDIGGTYSPTFNGNKILCGIAGSVTATAGLSYVSVSDTSITVNSKIFFQPANSSAATFLNSKHLVISAKSAGAFLASASDGSNFAGTEVFDYFIVQPPV